jgi:hypothetical protein
MSAGGSLTGSPNDQQPSPPPRKKRGPWKQIAIVFASAIVLVGSSCAGMFGMSGNHENLVGLAVVGFFVGIVAILVTIVWAIIALIIQLVRNRGVRE